MAGLSEEEAQKRLAESGPNQITQKKPTIWEKLLKNLFSPIGLMLILAAGLSYWTGKTFDGDFILVLLVLNIGITLWQEYKADSAVEKLNENLSQKVMVNRDGLWREADTRDLVAGDEIKLSAGDVIPADCKVVEANHLTVNESVLTGESLPRDKNLGDDIFSGSFVATGNVIAEVVSTGSRTSFGKTMNMVERVEKKSLLEKDIIRVSKFLTIASLSAVAILSVVYVLNKAPIPELLTLDLSLVIAGIPVSLPTVMTLIIEFGVIALASKQVIVRRMSALEDLANVNLLLTDKTGTLTQNKIEVSQIFTYGSYTPEEVIGLAATISGLNEENQIDKAILGKAAELKTEVEKFEKTDFIPADSVRKRSTLILKRGRREQIIVLGAAQVVAGLCKSDKNEGKKVADDVERMAKEGFRALAVAIKDGSRQEKDLELAGLLALSDSLRSDAKLVIQFLKQNGIDVAMVTGDNKEIAHHICEELELGEGKVVTKKELETGEADTAQAKFFSDTGAFAEILPDDKFRLVQKAKEFFVVAANGDGINDLPPVKAANVGFAVKNAVAALKSAADIVLTSDGIAVIKDAIVESRKIFERVYTYSVYRISESLRLIITIVILGIWYGAYPLTALQIILIALLNDIPIISLAFDRVRSFNRPERINVKERFILSSLFGLVGVANSMFLFVLLNYVLHTPWETIQTMYFLKLTVSGHLLIYVAHTKLRWWKFLPSKQVILATSITQLLATVFALTGFLMPGTLTVGQVVFVWIWALFWMQIGELTKMVKSDQ